MNIACLPQGREAESERNTAMKASEETLLRLERNPGEPVPCGLGLPVATWRRRGKLLLELVLEYPDIVNTGFGPDDRPWEQEVPLGYREGETYTDIWGCELRNVHGGMDGLIVSYPLDDWSKLDSYQVPDTLNYTDIGEKRDWRETADSFARTIAGGGFPGGRLTRFLYQRLHMLRGYDNLFTDIGEDHPNLHRLADMITDANLRVVDRYLELGAVFFSFGDHFGMQDRFPMGPQAWGRVFQPRYERLFQRVRQNGGRPSFYSDGHTVPIWDKFIAAGVTALRVQANCNTLEDMVRLLKGRVRITYDMDRQRLLPRGTADEIDANVRAAVEALGSPDGGLMMSARIEADTPPENLRAVLEAMRKYRGMWVE